VVALACNSSYFEDIIRGLWSSKKLMRCYLKKQARRTRWRKKMRKRGEKS
jgi:hypothetical protein